METIRLAFTDIAPDWDPRDNFFTQVLADSTRVKLEIVDSPDQNPDFVICGTFAHNALEYSCPRILYSGEDSWPDLNIYDYAIGFPWMEYDGRYLRYPLYAMRDSWEPALHKHQQVTKREKFCAFVVSNDFCETRNRFFDLLSEYKQVDSGGQYRNNIGGPVADKLAFQRQYKFSICFENSSTPGYLTEKLVDGFAAGTVPIYWGDPLAAREFNPDSFINAKDYPTLEALVEKVKEIDNDDEKWLAMASAPILNHDSRGWRYMDGRAVKDFLEDIFCYRKGQLRRNQSCWGVIYESDLRSAYRKLYTPEKPSLAGRLLGLLR